MMENLSYEFLEFNNHIEPELCPFTSFYSVNYATIENGYELNDIFLLPMHIATNEYY